MSESERFDLAASIARLRPSVERGHALLVVGASAQARAAWIEQARALDLPGGPLVVAVRARAEVDLTEVLTAAVEERLEQLRAPGALYDESSCAALPALGGWLFRARAAGRAGVLVVIEELDQALDLRGDRAHAEEALAALGELLEERERRPLSLLCTVRAADASGAPAIPAAVAALFDERAALGAATAIARDPASLVASLAGRSFNRASLARAVLAWTDVRDDESVIVFSSPLAPTMIPSALTAEEPEVRWPSDAPPNPRSAAGLRATSDEAPATRPERLDRIERIERATRDARHDEPARSKVTERWLPTLRAALALRSALDTLGDPTVRRSTRQLEQAFARSVSKIPLALEELRAGAPTVGAHAANLERRASDALVAFERAFREAYASAFVAWAAGASRPTMLPDLYERLHAMAAARAARTAALVLCTGLRADEWPALSTAIRARAEGLTVLEDGLHWAARPVTVAAQRALLARGAAALGAPLPERDEPVAPRSLEEASTPRREVTARGEYHRISAYHHRLSAPEAGSLSVRLEQARARVAPAVASFVAALPAGSLVLLAADVGATHPRSDDESAAGGEPSVFEALVPHAFLLWRAERV